MTLEERKALLAIYYDHDAMLRNVVWPKFDEMNTNHDVWRELSTSLSNTKKYIEKVLAGDRTIAENPIVRYMEKEVGVFWIDTLYILTFVDFTKSESEIWAYCGIVPEKKRYNKKVYKTLINSLVYSLLPLEKYNKKYLEAMEKAKKDPESANDEYKIHHYGKMIVLRIFLRDMRRAFHFELEETK